MRRVLSAVSIAVLLVVVSVAAVAAQEALEDLGNKSARVERAARGERLAPAGLSHAETVRAFLRSRHDEATLGNLTVQRRHEFRGVTHVDFRQRVAGLEVYGTYIRSSFTPAGDLVSLAENLIPAARALRPAQIGPDAAAAAVFARFYPELAVPAEETTIAGKTTFARPADFFEPPSATRIAVPLRGAVLDTGYLVVTWDRRNVLRHTVVSGRGEILHVEVRSSQDAYRIFPVSPAVSPQALVQGPGPTTASPFGWLGTSTTTTGNNVDAYLDRDNDGLADANGRPTANNQIFSFIWDGAAAPTTTTNQMAAVTNLFYLNNVVHDRLFQYGFTEGAGNFQQTNTSGQGLGGDPVRAEAQDGGGLNNANFATPPDGMPPRMQMYLWNTATPNRDGSLDSDIVYHEYGHGLTWRMIGDMSGVTGGAVGEGMSDVLAIYFNDDDRVAEYSANNAIGIRQYPYTNYPRTYGLVVGILGPHLDGEIYAATLWRLRQLWLSRGWSQDDLLTYIVDGMNYTVPKPAYEDMRDGILQSVATLDTGLDPEQASCTVWDAFAQYGVGVGASGTEICALGLCLFQAVESFVRPEECAAAPGNAAPQTSILLPTPGTTVQEGASVTFQGSSTDEEDGDLTASMTWTSSLQGQIGTGGSFARADLVAGVHVVTASATDSGSLTGSASVTLTVEAAPPPPNTAPTVTITAPPNGTTVTAGEGVTFAGTATDTEDGDISGSLVWTSNLHQGPIGTGASFSTSALVVGAHAITASVTDSGGLQGSAAIVVNVEAAPAPFTLSAATRTVRNKKFVDLTWSGATGTSVEVYRNGTRILASTPNDGAHTDEPKGKGRTFTYQICQTGGSTCSNSVTVSF